MYIESAVLKVDIYVHVSLHFSLQNLNQNPRTLLPKFYGFYCYQVQYIMDYKVFCKETLFYPSICCYLSKKDILIKESELKFYI